MAELQDDIIESPPGSTGCRPRQKQRRKRNVNILAVHPTVRVLALAVCSVALVRNLSILPSLADGGIFQNVETASLRNDNEVQRAFQVVLRNLTGETKSLEILFDRLGKMDVFDKAINNTTEEALRCARYGFAYHNETKRRRIFWGSIIADDSWHTLGITAMEAFGIFHTVALVESNRTHKLFPRELRFLEDSDSKTLLQSGMFGPDTNVTIDFYSQEEDMDFANGIFRNKLRNYEGEMLQREAVLERWKQNGMRMDDIGILGDVDEMWTRDFLRAVQICDVPEFRPGNDCRHALLRASGLNFEGSPQCIMEKKRIQHPGMIIGECINLIGDETKHKPVPRTFVERNPRPNVTVPDKFNATRGFRQKGYGGGWGRGGNSWTKIDPNTKYFPLWNAADYRLQSGGRHISEKQRKGFHTSFHFHNFFMSHQAIRFKYKTYGEALKDAQERPVAQFNKCTQFMMDCLLKRKTITNERLFARLKGGVKGIGGFVPLAFQSEAYVDARHNEIRKIMLDDEEMFNPKKLGNVSSDSEGGHKTT